jgi:archaemetzincin
MRRASVVVELVPLGATQAPVCRALAAALCEWPRLDLAVGVVEPCELPPELMAQSLTPADVLVDWLAKVQPWRRALTVTDRALCDAAGRPVDGVAELGGELGIVSYYRLRGRECHTQAGQGRWIDLLAWYALHELGHLFGLEHCAVAGCVMENYGEVRTLIDTVKPFCEACEGMWTARYTEGLETYARR